MIFDERLEYCIDTVYIRGAYKEGPQVLDLLQQMVDEGNGDACFLLARCLNGKYYVHPDFGFPEDEESVMYYLQKSIDLGSAIGMLGSLRFGGFKPRDGKYYGAPYYSLVEVFLQVLEYAKQGHPFCSFLIGHAYYWMDVPYMYGLQKDDQICREMYQNAIAFYEYAIREGIGMCATNIRSIVCNGNYNFPTDPIKARYLQNVKKVYSITFLDDTNDLYTPDEDDITYDICINAVNKGVLNAYGALGELYFRGGRTVQRDYAKAVECFWQVHEVSSKYDDLLGLCCLNGWGCQMDKYLAYELFKKCPNTRASNIGTAQLFLEGEVLPRSTVSAKKLLSQYEDDVYAMRLLRSIS